MVVFSFHAIHSQSKSEQHDHKWYMKDKQNNHRSPKVESVCVNSILNRRNRTPTSSRFISLLFFDSHLVLYIPLLRLIWYILYWLVCMERNGTLRQCHAQTIFLRNVNQTQLCLQHLMHDSCENELIAQWRKLKQVKMKILTLSLHTWNYARSMSILSFIWYCWSDLVSFVHFNPDENTYAWWLIEMSSFVDHETSTIVYD